MYYQCTASRTAGPTRTPASIGASTGRRAENAAGHDVTALRIETSIGGLNVSYAVDNGSGVEPGG